MLLQSTRLVSKDMGIKAHSVFRGGLGWMEDDVWDQFFQFLELLSLMRLLSVSVSFPSKFGVSCPVLVKWGRGVRNYNIVVITSMLNFSNCLEERPKLISPLKERLQDKTKHYLFWLCLLIANPHVCVWISCSICHFAQVLQEVKKSYGKRCT